MQNIENNANIAKIEITGFQDLCRRYGQLEQENKQLKANNKIMADELTYFKELCADLEEDVTKIKARCRELSSENHDLLCENNGMKFAKRNLLSDFEKAEIAAEKHEKELVAAMGSYLGDDY